jgi:hypothetical protein
MLRKRKAECREFCVAARSKIVPKFGLFEKEYSQVGDGVVIIATVSRFLHATIRRQNETLD